MECQDAREMLDRGQETPELLRHLAACPACRARTETTDIMRVSPIKAARKAHHFRGRSLASLMPYIVGGLASLIIVLALGILLMRARTPARRVTPPPPREVHAPQLYRLTVESEPMAEVFINGRPAGMTPYVHQLGRGAYDVEVRAKDYSPARRVIHLQDADALLHFVLEKTPPKVTAKPERATDEDNEDEPEVAPPPGSNTPTTTARVPAKPEARTSPIPPSLHSSSGSTGYISLTSAPWARVFLDGQDTGRSTPIVKMSLPVGKHEIELRTPKKTIKLTTTIAKGREARIHKLIE